MRIKQYIDNFLNNYTHYKDYWNYEDGCVLMGCKQLYQATGERKYLDFILNYLDPLIAEDGTVTNYETGKHNIDGFNAGKVLFIAYDETGNEKYRKAIDFLIKDLMGHPRTESGNFFHKAIYPNQVWLDGLYMAQPFYAEYETRYNKKENYADILSQYRNVRRNMYNEQKQLYYHGFDEAKIQPWANKETGLSPNFWLRSMGWLLMSLIDVIDATSQEIYENYRELCDMFKEAVNGILPYRDEKTGMFLQVIDHPEADGNYAETSGSAMVAYAIMKGCRLGVLNSEKYSEIGISIFDSIVGNKLVTDNGDTHLADICWVAGLGPGEKRDGSVEYYLSEKIVSDDSKGVGPFMMAYAQSLLLNNERNGH